MRILAINPGSTSTKITSYADISGDLTVEMDASLNHSAGELEQYARMIDQLAFRREAVLNALTDAEIPVTSLDAVVGRGGLVYPIPGGTYAVNDAMIADLTEGVLGEHASNLGGILAREIADAAGGRPAYIVDPVVVDELVDDARLSGSPEIPRVSIFHALNQKAVARRVAADRGTTYEELNLVIAHMGGGVTVGAHRGGRVIDVNDGLNGEGPFTPERSGALPALKLIRLCFSGDYTEDQLRRMVKGGGGLVAYLGTNDAREISRRIDAGDATAEQVYRGMAWQIRREIGAAVAALGCTPDAIVLTGGLAHDTRLTGWITDGVEWIADVLCYPGENEMIALAEGAYRVLTGTEAAAEYTGKVVS